MKCYRYDANTFEYVGEEDAIENNVTNRETQEWLLPAYCTLQEPPSQRKGCVIIWDDRLKSWYNEVDNRETKVVDKKTHKMFQYGKIGEIPDNLTTVMPNWEYEKWLKFDEESDGWILDEAKKEDLIEKIWELRKELRKLKCQQPIEYKDHLIKVDSDSLNDLILASQEDSGKRTWICADGEVEYDRDDFKKILHLFFERREKLVHESNEEWKKDTMKKDRFLLMTLSKLNSEIAFLLSE